jgi:hypothetical protein
METLSMQKLKALLLSLNMQITLVCLFTARLVIFGAGIGDAIALLSLCGLYGYMKWLDQHQYKKPTEDIQRQLEEFKNVLAVFRMGQAIKPNKPDDQKPTRYF